MGEISFVGLVFVVNIDKIFGGSVDDIIDKWEWEFGDDVSDVIEVELCSVFEVLEQVFFYLIGEKFSDLDVVSDDKAE